MSDTSEKVRDVEKNNTHAVHVEEKQVDEAAHFRLGREVTPEEALRVRKKIDWHIMPMMMSEPSSLLFSSFWYSQYDLHSSLLVCYLPLARKVSSRPSPGCNSWIRSLSEVQPFVSNRIYPKRLRTVIGDCSGTEVSSYPKKTASALIPTCTHVGKTPIWMRTSMSTFCRFIFG